ncbi:cathepsin L-like [Stegodyphus dumicola]|uniref:cathepsin L-like n=1 Tax=Stegodyphus dumicola TaxID=202533 RepID=UPI0015AB20E1|nr:cathepsin L-like [Stegodyphus dumicola]XP_035229284.1 cathepsin L-like [Stegodyphus dumicola]XP_035229285.1 cathepsin L-like [Stegodyphus dumicola]XP_035229286.1 cathepsin L-like [Stegodyphus dumicola]
MKVLLTFLAFCGFIYASSAYVSEKDVLKEEWEAFKLEFKKFYGETEGAFKMKGFMENKHKIAQLNQFYFKDRNSKKAQYILKAGQDYGNKKLYEETEDAFRMKVFMENKHKIARHNQLYSKGKKSYSLAMNKFGDLVSKIV